MKNKLVRLDEGNGEAYMFDCPGCMMSHMVYVHHKDYRKPCWTWNGNMQKPTFQPSLLVQWEHGENNEKRACHSFITDGRIHFLNDSTHGLAGQVVDLLDAEE